MPHAENLREGQQFRIRDRVLALERPNGETTAFYIPAGAIVKVKHLPRNGDLLVDVLWSGRTVMIFCRELLEYGERVMNAGTEG
ncbi:MAG TPA: hypothetical protein VME17_11390 [Bryobacteraceae bacterium]|nr:hypothetical protein [Bryobacteraceae bacterium]